MPQKTAARFPGAGTDSDVCCRLHGVLRSAKTLALSNGSAETTGRPFGRGKRDVFLQGPVPDLGKLTMVQVWHNNKRGAPTNFRQADPGWFLSKVVVEKVLGTTVVERTRFPCNAWLDRERWDKIEVRLTPEE